MPDQGVRSSHGTKEFGSARMQRAKGGRELSVRLWCAKGWDRQAWLGRCRRVLLGHASNMCEKAELAGRGLCCELNYGK